MDFVANWGWPQWIVLIMLFLALVIQCGNNGKDRVFWSGPDKGKPERYNATLGFLRFILWTFLLVAGGFSR